MSYNDHWKWTVFFYQEKSFGKKSCLGNEKKARWNHGEKPFEVVYWLGFVIFYGFYHGKSPWTTTIWENIFFLFVPSILRMSFCWWLFAPTKKGCFFVGFLVSHRVKKSHFFHVLRFLFRHFLGDSRWWFQICFIFTPTWGRFPIWLIFFQMGWNHQLVIFFTDFDPIKIFITMKKNSIWGCVFFV